MAARDRYDGCVPTPLTDLAFGILLTLADTEMHGYALLKELREHDGRASLRTGTVYAALARLQDEGLVEEVGDRADETDDQRRRYYGLTAAGRSAARAEAQRLAGLVSMARDKRLLPERA